MQKCTTHATQDRGNILTFAQVLSASPAEDWQFRHFSSSNCIRYQLTVTRHYTGFVDQNLGHCASSHFTESLALFIRIVQVRPHVLLPFLNIWNKSVVYTYINSLYTCTTEALSTWILKFPRPLILRADRRPWSAAVASKNIILHPWIGLQLSLKGQISLMNSPISRKTPPPCISGFPVICTPSGYMSKQTIGKTPLASDNGGKDSLRVQHRDPPQCCRFGVFMNSPQYSLPSILKRKDHIRPFPPLRVLHQGSIRDYLARDLHSKSIHHFMVMIKILD